MGAILQFAVNLEEFECSECGIVYALAQNYVRSRRENASGTGKRWVCPNGHGQSFTKSEAAILREKLAAEEAARKRAEDDASSARRQRDEALRRVKSEKTKRQNLSRRIAAGVCPCCHRTVRQLAAHMKTKHPEYGGEPKAEP